MNAKKLPPGLVELIPGITEGGAIIIGLIVVAILVLFYFGRIFAKRLEATFQEMRGVSQQVTDVKHQVKNDHAVNMRDDMDIKDTNQHDKLDSLTTLINNRFDAMNARISGLDSRVSGIDARLNTEKVEQ